MSAASACVGADCCPLSSHPQWGRQMLEMSSFICCLSDICVCPQLAVVTKCLAGSTLREECFFSLMVGGREIRPAHGCGSEKTRLPAQVLADKKRDRTGNRVTKAPSSP